MISDKELIAKVQSGETDKLGLLYERHKKAVFAYFFKLTGGDQYLSEDLVHAVFLRILKYSKNFKGEGTFLAWLFSITRNVGLDHHRTKKNTENIDDVKYKITNTEDYYDELIKIEQQKLLRKALASLKFEEKEVLILGKLKELTYKEVGTILNCTEGTVKTRVFRALKSLKKAYLELEKH